MLLAGFHKNEISNVCHVYGREFLKFYILKRLDGLIISSDIWHNLNVLFKYVVIVDFAHVKISLVL